MKTIIKLIVVGALLIGCGGGNPLSILDDETKEEPSNILELKIVKRKVSFDELVGTWVFEKNSTKRYIALIKNNSHYNNKKNLEELKESLNSYSLSISKDATAKFKDIFYEKYYEGKVQHGDMKDWYKSEKEGQYLRISAPKGESWKTKYLYCMEINKELYLAEEYGMGDGDIVQPKRYILYQKVK